MHHVNITGGLRVVWCGVVLTVCRGMQRECERMSRIKGGQTMISRNFPIKKEKEKGREMGQ